MRKYVPWHTKIALKIILARLPVPYRVWAGLNLFKHGDMANVEHARNVFRLHAGNAVQRGAPRDGVYLELGPGDSAAAVVLAAAEGAQHTYLVDIGAFATRDMAFYRELAATLRREGADLPVWPADLAFEGMLALCNASYLTDGVESLRSIPENSVDILWSQATLEHVRRREFAEIMRATHRVLKPGGIASHYIDLKDHLGGALNNLRFSEDLWEREWMARSGFYTNRLRRSEIIDTVERSGFICEDVNERRYPALPTPRDRMAAPFRDMPDEELLVHDMVVVLRKARGQD